MTDYTIYSDSQGVPYRVVFQGKQTDVIFLTVLNILKGNKDLKLNSFTENHIDVELNQKGELITSPEGDGTIPQTGHPRINDDHAKMASTLMEFKRIAVEHWQTETRIYNENVKQLPPDHVGVSSMWAEHDAQHQKFINRIDGLLGDLVSHIEKYDVPQFHSGQSYVE